MWKKIFLSTLTLLLLTLSSFCQKPKYDTSVFIGGFQTSKFYAGEFNALGVYTPNYPIQSLVIKASQGNLENIDNH